MIRIIAAMTSFQTPRTGGPGPADAPRPPADVLGGEWSVWLAMAVAVVAVAVGAAVVLGYRRWVESRAERGPGPGAPPPREEALRELDRILGLEWHRNGRVADFYEASTGALRRFAARVEPGWATSLTSRELMSRMQERWGREVVEPLAGTVEAAERVKFGGERPGPEAAEEDWRTIREWVRDAPEAG